MDIYTAHYRGEQAVLMYTNKVRKHAEKLHKSKKTRINYAALKLQLKERFPGIKRFYAAKDRYMPENVVEALTKDWELMNWSRMKRILKRNQNQQVEGFSKLFHNLLNHCIGN